jgi:hypothetical protein
MFFGTDIVGLSTGGAEAMRIDSSGNVGIGTTTPSTNLNVYNASSAIISVDGDNTSQFRGSRYANDASGAQILARKARGTLASPSAVNSADQAGVINFQVYGGTNFRNVAQVQGACEAFTSDTNVAGTLFFLTNAGGTTLTERMRITAAGNVGIGTTVPGAKLTVVSSATPTIAALQVGFSGSNNYYDANLQVFRNGSQTESMRIDSSGNVQIGATSNLDNARLQVNPPVNAWAIATRSPSSSGTYYYINFSAAGTQTGYILSANGTTTAYVTSSDYRLKENIAPITGALDKVAQLKPCTYTWKVNGSAGEGFVAHELQEVCPGAVTGEKDGDEMQGVDYGKITPLLTAALQEALAKIETLEARIAALETK